jgi:hypothetical protein
LHIQIVIFHFVGDTTRNRINDNSSDDDKDLSETSSVIEEQNPDRAEIKILKSNINNIVHDIVCHHDY